MTEHSFTPALWVFGIVLGILLSCGEMLWLARPFSFQAAWPSLLVIALVNAAFIYVAIGSLDSYGFLFIAPIPLVPAAYVLLKAVTYAGLQRFYGPLHRPWLVAVITLLTHAVIVVLAYVGFSTLNPTQDNLVQAIRDQRNRRLAAMLWISIKFEPNMTILVNEAIQDHNDGAVDLLIRRGADPNQSYRLRDATPVAEWRITKWMIDRGVTQEHFDQMSESLPFGALALGHGTVELEYCLRHGYNLRFPGSVNLALTEQRLRQPGTIQPDEVQTMKEKIRILLDHGADVNGRDVEGQTPILTLMTMSLDLPEVLSYLIEKGADVNLRTAHEMYPPDFRELPRGLTPLMVAAVIKPQYVGILTKSGADKAARDSAGRTALDYAVERKSAPEVLAMLR